MSTSAAAIESKAAPASIFIVSIAMWAMFLVACAAIGLAFEPSLRSLIDVWYSSEEFSYGPVLPFICGFLIWQQRDFIERQVFNGSWLGLGLLVAATTVALIGQGAAVPAVAHYGLVFSVAALALATTGWSVFKKLLGAFAILILAIPLPAFFLNTLSLEMQMISSKIGILVVRLFGISVFLEGNVIDLGVYKLEVAEACNGLRYLFPLMVLGFLMAYLFKVAMWKRVVLFLSCIPITIFMNSFRIGVIGVMVDRWGTEMAEGFMHDFQGWVVFMCSTAIMIVEMIVLASIGNDRRPWREVFGLEFPPPRAAAAPRIARRIHPPLIAATAFTVAIAGVAMLSPQHKEVIPERTPFVAYPNSMSDWSGYKTPMESIYLDALKLDDYLLTDYRRSGGEMVNFYVAWYNSQRSGQSAHSPRSCLPGGGWKMTTFEQVDILGVNAGDTPLRVNRAVIEMGQQRQLVYYWFQQRGRVITSEYMVKWYLFWDSLTRKRSDGSLVRLVTPLSKDEDMVLADARLTQFARHAVPQLDAHIPR